MMKRSMGILCLCAVFLLFLTSCNESEPILREHTHVYVSTHTSGTCLRYGYTEYRCHCGDHYTLTDTAYGDHKLILPAENIDLPQAVLLYASVDYHGIKGSYCSECGVYFSFERIDKTTPDLPPL